MATTFAPKAEGKVHTYLREAGWTISGVTRAGKVEWRHPRLNWPWTTASAEQLQREADSGRMESTYRQLRGED